jgi:hypothetical protein
MVTRLKELIYNEEFHNLYCAGNIATDIKIRTMKPSGRAAS